MSILIIVLFCHFLTAFTALGMPLFMPRMLNSLSTGNTDYLVGIMFVVPVLCSAFSAPWWGRFADKYGKKRSLLRSQLGLTCGFLMSGFADTLTLFSLGLIVQGISGGTLAASNAYLSSMYKGPSLAKSLNLTQFSARLALVSAPLLLGYFTETDQPLLVYRYLALLPCTALIISLFLPKDEHVIDVAIKPTNKPSKNTAFSQLLYLQFLFCFAMVVTFPYFLPYVQSLGDVRDTMAGFYYSLPHLVYLLLAFFIAKLTLSAHLQSLSGFVLLGSACLGQFALNSSEGLIIYRLLFGLGMLLSYSGLHLFLSERLEHQKAGLSFGRFDAWGKWAGVFAGFSASFISQFFSLSWPFLLATVACTVAILILILNGKESPTYVEPIT